MELEGRQEILLETGTNEVEIAIFTVGQQCFGTNVAKIREFIIYDENLVTRISHTCESVIGTFLLRGHTIPLIDLNRHLNKKGREEGKTPVIIVTEFNNLVNGFLVDNVDRIIRVSWTAIEPMSAYYQDASQKVTGSVQFEGTDILLLDMEQIISELFPEQMKELSEIVDAPPEEGDVLRRRSRIKVMIAEDSNLIRNLMLQNLTSAGYVVTQSFDNGKDALDYITTLVRNQGTKLTDELTLLITDIEMPQMDGLTLCRKVKEELKLKTVPIVIFSSLINEQMAQKCEQVGADGYITKPEIMNLVKLVDSLTLK